MLRCTCPSVPAEHINMIAGASLVYDNRLYRAHPGPGDEAVEEDITRQVPLKARQLPSNALGCTSQSGDAHLHPLIGFLFLGVFAAKRSLFPEWP